ncbi:T9SS-dependent M36 family metallopeptidase [Chryseobacterium caseinilyticum]|nr:T9SS-dependent M36 family metallopeptidase [Chryseobacterium caseinilyticum]
MKKLTLPLLFAVALSLSSVSTVYGQDHKQLVSNYISQNKIRDYKKADLTNFVIDVNEHSESMNADVVKIQQTYQGIPVYGATGSVLIKNNRVILYNDNFEKDYHNVTSNTPSITKESALGFAAQGIAFEDLSKVQILDFRHKDIDKEFAKYQLVYAKNNQDLVLCYEFTFPERKTPNYWNILVNANTGEIVVKNNLNVSCDFVDHPYGHSHEDHANILPLTKDFYPESNPSSSILLAPDPASYNVFPFPVEAPTYGSRSIVTNPWNLAASPEGWHSDGTTHYTSTQGNNVNAYQDLYDFDFFSGVAAEGGASRNFNFPYTSGALALTNQDAAITNLFYANNMVHDIFYNFGFTPAFRNFQKNNFSLGGVGNDFVNAEAQDGAATEVTATVSNYNNANFATPQDGGSGRMQMYVWVNNAQKLFYNTPASAITRTPASFIAQFGPQITGVPVTGNVKLSPVLDACTALPSGSLTGFIGLAERGTCDFNVKVENMQNAGATGALIYNAPSSTAPGNMGGTNPNVYIMSELMDNAEGEYIKSQLANNIPVNVSMSYSTKQDGSFDNGVMIHEYGHGISTRLTGNGYSCLQSSQSKEQMGEGWSDFFALMLTNQPNDNASVARGIGTYVSAQATSGSGIRPAKYSPSFSVNAYTYGNTNGMEFTNSNGQIQTDVHSIGFVWATMLWDLHWKYVEKYGYASNVMSNTTNGSSRVLQLVTNALKIQPCNPSFVEGRDAILAAELAMTNGADRCMIWNVFGARGLGLNASAGVKSNINDQVQSFLVPTDCVLSTDEVKDVKANAISIYPNPAKNEFFINFPKNTMGKVNVEIFDMSGKLVASEYKVSADEKKAINTSSLINGTYIVKVKGLGIDTSSKLLIKK